jgi:hypothetical protein
MNNTINILLVAIITATLLTGTSVIPMQSFADKGNDDDHKKTKDFKSSIKESSDSSKKSAKQHQDQDNFCYRGDDCEQANQGQQIIGENNDAKGFNDQSDNLALSEDGNGAGNGNGNGTGNGNGNGTGTSPFTPPVGGACTSPLVLANITIGSAAAVEACVNLSLVGPLLPPVGGTCIAPLVAATIELGSSTVRACVLPGFLAA